MPLFKISALVLSLSLLASSSSTFQASAQVLSQDSEQIDACVLRNAVKLAGVATNPEGVSPFNWLLGACRRNPNVRG